MTSFGGISGSGAYIMPPITATTEDELFLGGFVYEASLSGNVIYVSHADRRDDLRHSRGLAVSSSVEVLPVGQGGQDR